jgi:hypothetical protein
MLLRLRSSWPNWNKTYRHPVRLLDDTIITTTIAGPLM